MSSAINPVFGADREAPVSNGEVALSFNGGLVISEFPRSQFSEIARSGSAADFRDVEGFDVGARVAAHANWYDQRVAHDLWPYNKTTIEAPGVYTSLFEETGRKVSGVNLASQDYLSLARHEGVVAAAIEAVQRYGVHSSGSGALMGNTQSSRLLERKIGEALGYEHVLLYPTGWAAGYGALRGLARPSDHIVLDSLAHNCLQDGAQSSGARVYRTAHIHLKHTERILRGIRSKDVANAIFVVTEGLFSMDSDTPDLNALQQLCAEYKALLILDVAHDFGVLGVSGRSSIEEADLIGKVDVVMGSFSKTFASNGGFLCTNDHRVLKYLRLYSTSWMFSNALSPVQAASVAAAMNIVFSAEGDRLREALFNNIKALRIALLDGGLHCHGRPSPIVPVTIGTELEVRVANYLAASACVLTNIAEYPVVPRGNARFRLQVQAGHTAPQMIDAADRIVSAARAARVHCARCETSE